MYWLDVNILIFVKNITVSVIESTQAILIRAHVAGTSNENSAETPASIRADLIASLMAKKTDAAKNSGGSPTAWKLI